MNLPNKLTLGRIIIIPFFVFFLVYNLFDNPNISRLISATLFIIASVTDFLDGYLARSRNLITDFGKFMDPLADKFLILGAMFAICFSDYIFDYQAVGFETVISVEIIKHLFFWTAIVVVFRELAVTSMRLVVAKSSGAVIAASSLGKIKTVTQIVATCAVMLEPVILPFCQGIITLISTVLMLAFTLISGINYIMTYWKFINTNK
ncbi:MAG: CDP-diacylglycerol--glycerol-3-phosphate 3-phosphatidyltransferase [Ruminococcaceae bacterium]|nr:CDP-diacylglycerol--glycerol-3-phosphate 3-phosphatidyltransferase [Oscillospiraceae bacterium]